MKLIRKRTYKPYFAQTRGRGKEEERRKGRKGKREDREVSNDVGLRTYLLNGVKY
jgi:hypothetical protein